MKYVTLREWKQATCVTNNNNNNNNNDSKHPYYSKFNASRKLAVTSSWMCEMSQRNAKYPKTVSRHLHSYLYTGATTRLVGQYEAVVQG